MCKEQWAMWWRLLGETFISFGLAHAWQPGDTNIVSAFVLFIMVIFLLEGIYCIYEIKRKGGRIF